MVQFPIVSMVATAVPVPAWHTTHGVATLTHLCEGVRGGGCKGRGCERRCEGDKVESGVMCDVVWCMGGCGRE